MRYGSAARAAHYLLPYEGRFADRVVKQQRLDRTPDVLRQEWNLGPDGIRLRAAADVNRLAGALLARPGRSSSSFRRLSGRCPCPGHRWA
jgi:hypothetical protein